MNSIAGISKVMKSAIIGLDPVSPPAATIVFENYPETILP
jgi:hypothetical protein